MLAGSGVRLDNSDDQGTAATVWDDDDQDSLKGDAGKDWYFAELDDPGDEDDKVKLSGDEIVDEVDNPL